MAPISDVYLGDCMDLMGQFPDGYFDLAIVDPPYGIGEDGKSNHSRDTIADGRLKNRKGKIIPARKYSPKEWDKEPPPPEYFRELFRVSKHQIIWGANHFISRMPIDSQAWIVWDKVNTGIGSRCELAWTSFKSTLSIFRFLWNGMFQGKVNNGTEFIGNLALKETRIHPTQKPVALYSWLLQNYAKPGWKILDTHLGSMSSRIAAYKLGFDFWGAELDPDYYRDGCKRFDEAIRMPLFDGERERKDIVQANFFDALDGL